MKKLTNEEIKEPDMTLIIPPDVWVTLPDEVKDTLAHWVDRGDAVGIGQHIYVLPAYRARELEAITKHHIKERTALKKAH